MEGLIVVFIEQRKFGFIYTDDGQKIFFHTSNFNGTPVLGQRVTFRLAPPIVLGKPEQAVDVTPVSVTPVSTVEDVLTPFKAVGNGF